MSLPLNTDDRRAREVVGVLLADITADLATGPLTPDRRLGDLGLESISLVYLIAEVQQELDLGDRLLGALRNEPPTDLRTITVEAFSDLVAGLLTEPDRPAASAPERSAAS